ncbi:MAG: phosphate ABC transporter ATP-binding protein, partial [Microcystis aeruginosa]
MLTNSNPHSIGTVLKVDKADIYYGNYRAVRDVSIDIPKNR